MDAKKRCQGTSSYKNQFRSGQSGGIPLLLSAVVLITLTFDKASQLRFDQVSYFAGALELFIFCSGESRRIRKTPIDAPVDAGENGTFLHGCVVADPNYVLEHFARAVNSKTILVWFPLISMPISFITSIASGFKTPGSMPAFIASKRSPAMLFSNASAIWLRRGIVHANEQNLCLDAHLVYS